jgi:ABC-type branched-subunit amino acid transport system substrate-binding protein
MTHSPPALRLQLGTRLLGALPSLIGVWLASCAPNEAAPVEGIKIGLLLPFTGDAAATSSNFERAAIMAADTANRAGGVHGKSVQLISKDTHSDIARARQSTNDLINDGVTAIVGTESADISQAILPSLVARGVAFVSPLVGSAASSGSNCPTPWFRLAPSAKALGEALAKLMSARKVERMALLAADDEFNAALADAAASRFASLHGTVTARLTVSSNSHAYGTLLNAIAHANVEAVLVALPPVTAALAMNESQIISGFHTNWYLSPLLKTDLFVQNVDPSVVEGAQGIAPAIDETQDDYPKAFADRWRGDLPLEGAYYYYDAVALVAMALQASSVDDSGKFNYTNLITSIRNVAGPPGQETEWSNLSEGLDNLANGVRAYYVGLTGALVMSSCGERLMGTTSQWTIADGKIQNICSSPPCE